MFQQFQIRIKFHFDANYLNITVLKHCCLKTYKWDALNYIFFPVERDPKKRRVKPVGAPLLDFDIGESSDDSDFRIEDHCEESDDDSEDSNDIGKGKHEPLLNTLTVTVPESI